MFISVHLPRRYSWQAGLDVVVGKTIATAVFMLKCCAAVAGRGKGGSLEEKWLGTKTEREGEMVCSAETDPKCVNCQEKLLGTFS